MFFLVVSSTLFVTECTQAPSTSLAPPSGTAQRVPTTAALNSVLQYHKNATRDGLYIDPLMTPSYVSQMQLAPGFSAPWVGPVYAQPLFFEAGVNGKDAVFVATEQNQVLALDASTGATLWQVTLGTPAPLSSLPCGDIDPLGVTGTPIIDPVAHTLYLDAMMSADGGATNKHWIFALSTDDGSTLLGWPVDVQAALATRGLTFNTQNQNQRGALALLGDSLYVPYGGHYGDCGDYHGWVVGIKTATPTSVTAWSTGAAKGGVWAPGGIATDGTSLYFGSGNTEGATTWAAGDAILKLPPSLIFSNSTDDFFTPPNWQALDAADQDLGSAGPALIDIPSQTPSHLVLAMGKNGVAYSLDRDHLGGISSTVSQFQAAGGVIISSPVVYSAPSGTFVAFKAVSPDCGNGVTGPDFMALRISPKNQLSFAWCATQSGRGSPIVTTTDGSQDAVVWTLGAEGDNKLHAFDGQSGAELYTSAALPLIRRFQTPIEAKGSLYIATETGLAKFSSK